MPDPAHPVAADSRRPGPSAAASYDEDREETLWNAAERLTTVE